jgi:hypothetical protein
MKSIKFTFLGKAFMLAFLSFGLVNCDKDKVEVEETPDFSTTFKGVAIKPITVSKPATTTYVAGSITTPPAVASTIAALKAGTISPALASAMSKVPDATSKAIFSLLTPSVLADLKAGKPMPTAIALRLNGIIESGAINAFRSTVTLPKLNDKPIGNRFAAPGSTNTVKAEQEMFSTMNACNDALKKEFDAAKKILDDGKAVELAKVKAAYDQNIKAADVTKEKEDALKRRNSASDVNQKSFDEISLYLRELDLPDDQFTDAYVTIVAIYYQLEEQIDILYSKEIDGLNEKAKDITKKVENARDRDTDKINSDYDGNLSGITFVFKSKNEECHNQGGGN